MIINNLRSARSPRPQWACLRRWLGFPFNELRKFPFKFMKSTGGTALVEFALILPILLMLVLGAFEMTRYIIIQQKISKTVSTMGDLVARSPSLASADITNMYAAVPHLMEPYSIGAKQVVILTNVSNNGSATKVNWQRKGGGTYVANSKIGAVGATAKLPAGFTLAVNEDTIISEIYYSYQPIVAPNIVAAQVIYRAKYYKPRLGALTVINP